MKKHNSILVLVAVFALIATSCNLQINTSNNPQPRPIPQGQQQPGPIPQGQPGPIPQGQPGPGPIPQDQQQPQPLPPTPGLPPAPTQASGSSGSSGSSSSGSGCAGAPQIPYFNASSTSITAGQTVTLSWGNVTNGTTGPMVGSTTIEPGLGEVGSGASSRTVKPTTTTTYTLTGTGCGGTTSKQVTVTVNSSSGSFPLVPIPAVKANWDLAVDNIYPASNGHIMVTIKNAGNITMSASIPLTCSGTKTTSTTSGPIGPKTQTVSINLKAGAKTDIDTGFARDPTISTMLVSCSITPPSGDTNSSNDSKSSIKVK